MITTQSGHVKPT